MVVVSSTRRCLAYLVLIWTLVQVVTCLRDHPAVMVKEKEMFLIKYKNGRNIIPVNVRMDYKQRMEYVMNLSPLTNEKSLTMYDFNKRIIAFKDLLKKHCFISRMEFETITSEVNKLKQLQNEIIVNLRPVTMYANNKNLAPKALSNIAGPRIARFCNKMKTSLISGYSRKKRNADDYLRQSYGHYGKQSQEYAHHGHETRETGKGYAPLYQETPPQGSPDTIKSETRYSTSGTYNGDRSASHPARGGLRAYQHGGFELNQPLGLPPIGSTEYGAKSSGSYGSGQGYSPISPTDSNRRAPYLPPPGWPSSPGQDMPKGGTSPDGQDQVYRFPLQPNGSLSRPPYPPGTPVIGYDSRSAPTNGHGASPYSPVGSNGYPDRNGRPGGSYGDKRTGVEGYGDKRTGGEGYGDKRTGVEGYGDKRTGVEGYGDKRPGGNGSPDSAYDDRRPGGDDITRRSDYGAAPDYRGYPSHTGYPTNGRNGALTNGGSSAGRDYRAGLSPTTGALGSTGTRAVDGAEVSSDSKVKTGRVGTNAEASSTGAISGQRSQTQVQGAHAGNGTFSAQAQAGFISGNTQSQIRGGRDGGSSLSSASVNDIGNAQSQVQVGTPDGTSSGMAQGTFTGGGTQAEAQGHLEGGSASAQSQSSGLSQSNAQVNARGEHIRNEFFEGEVSANTRGSYGTGSSSTNLQGNYGAAKKYGAAATGSFDTASRGTDFRTVGFPASPGGSRPGMTQPVMPPIAPLERSRPEEYGRPGDRDRRPAPDAGRPSPSRPDYGRPATPDYGRPSIPSRDYGRPSPDTSRPSPDYGRPSSPDSGRPSTDYGRPSSPDTGRPSSPDTGRPSPDYGRPSSTDSGRPSPDYGRPSPDSGRPSTDYGRPSPDSGRPSPDYGRPSPDTGRPSPDYGRPSPDSGRPSPDYGRPSSPDTGRPSPDYGRPSPDSGRPSPDYGRPSPDTGRPSPDYGRPSPDTGRPSPDYGRPSPDTGRPSPDYGRPSMGSIDRPDVYTKATEKPRSHVSQASDYERPDRPSRHDDMFTLRPPTDRPASKTNGRTYPSPADYDRFGRPITTTTTPSPYQRPGYDPYGRPTPSRPDPYGRPSTAQEPKYESPYPGYPGVTVTLYPERPRYTQPPSDTPTPPPYTQDRGPSYPAFDRIPPTPARPDDPFMVEQRPMPHRPDVKSPPRIDPYFPSHRPGQRESDVTPPPSRPDPYQPRPATYPTHRPDSPTQVQPDSERPVDPYAGSRTPSRPRPNGRPASTSGCCNQASCCGSNQVMRRFFNCCGGGSNGNGKAMPPIPDIPDGKDGDCEEVEVTCYTVYKTIGRARICQPGTSSCAK